MDSCEQRSGKKTTGVEKGRKRILEKFHGGVVPKKKRGSGTFFRALFARARGGFREGEGVCRERAACFQKKKNKCALRKKY